MAGLQDEQLFRTGNGVVDRELARWRHGRIKQGGSDVHRDAQVANGAGPLCQPMTRQSLSEIT